MIKFLLCAIASFPIGRILGWLASKLNLGSYSLFIAIAIGVVTGVLTEKLYKWHKNTFLLVITILIMSIQSYFTFQYEDYLALKKNFPPGTPPPVLELRNAKEPEGFIKYAMLTANDPVEFYARRRGLSSMPKVGWWAIELAGLTVGILLVRHSVS